VSFVRFYERDNGFRVEAIENVEDGKKHTYTTRVALPAHWAEKVTGTQLLSDVLSPEAIDELFEAILSSLRLVTTAGQAQLHSSTGKRLVYVGPSSVMRETMEEGADNMVAVGEMMEQQVTPLFTHNDRHASVYPPFKSIQIFSEQGGEILRVLASASMDSKEQYTTSVANPMLSSALEIAPDAPPQTKEQQEGSAASPSRATSMDALLLGTSEYEEGCLAVCRALQLVRVPGHQLDKRLVLPCVRVKGAGVAKCNGVYYRHTSTDGVPMYRMPGTRLHLLRHRYRSKPVMDHSTRLGSSGSMVEGSSSSMVEGSSSSAVEGGSSMEGSSSIDGRPQLAPSLAKGEGEAGSEGGAGRPLASANSGDSGGSGDSLYWFLSDLGPSGVPGSPDNRDYYQHRVNQDGEQERQGGKQDAKVLGGKRDAKVLDQPPGNGWAVCDTEQDLASGDGEGDGEGGARSGGDEGEGAVAKGAMLPVPQLSDVVYAEERMTEEQRRMRVLMEATQLVPARMSAAMVAAAEARQLAQQGLAVSTAGMGIQTKLQFELARFGTGKMSLSYIRVRALPLETAAVDELLGAANGDDSVAVGAREGDRLDLLVPESVFGLDEGALHAMGAASKLQLCAACATSLVYDLVVAVDDGGGRALQLHLTSTLIRSQDPQAQQQQGAQQQQTPEQQREMRRANMSLYFLPGGSSTSSKGVIRTQLHGSEEALHAQLMTPLPHFSKGGQTTGDKQTTSG
jgi:hypothetical protein